MNQVVQFRSGDIPRPMSPALAKMVAAFRSHLRPEGHSTFSILSQSAPDETVRRLLANRINEIDAWFRPAETKAIRTYVGQLFAAMPAPSDERQDPKELRAIVELYVVALEKFPIFAIKQAFELALRGKVGATGGRFRPNPAEMALACEREMQFFLKERRSINDILDAEIAKERSPEPERRKLAAAILAELKNARPPNEVARGFAQAKVNDGLTPKERAEERRAQPLPLLSEAAMALIKRKDVAAE